MNDPLSTQATNAFYPIKTPCPTCGHCPTCGAYKPVFPQYWSGAGVTAATNMPITGGGIAGPMPLGGTLTYSNQTADAVGSQTVGQQAKCSDPSCRICYPQG